MSFNGRNFKKKQGNRKILVVFIVLILIVLLVVGYISNKSVDINKNYYFSKGENISKIVSDLKFFDRVSFRWYLKSHKTELADFNIRPGVYNFSGSYTKPQIIELFKEGPTQKYLKFVILEGRSKYDVDRYLSSKSVITGGDYIKFVDDLPLVKKYVSRFEFLKNSDDSISGGLKSLDGFLYPDTYLVDPAGNIIDQLVYLQLDAFSKKVWEKIKKTEISSFISKTSKDYGLAMNIYKMLILASIIEKEEKNDKNKPVISSIFLNRLKSGMRIDADISLCYGLKISYEECTVEKISSNLKDTSNPYNTRAVDGIPPSPIGNPSIDTIESLLNYQKNDYLYYLHGNDGVFYPAKDLQQHNINKSKYLSN